MKKVIMFSALAMLLASCTKNEMGDVNPVADGERIAFNAYAGVSSRATVINNDNVASIKIFGVDGSDVITNLSNAQYDSSNKKATGTWGPKSSNPAASWVNVAGGTADFYAFAPVDAITAGFSLPDGGGVSFASGYNVSTTPADQKDLVLAKTLGVGRHATVALKFFHALSQIKFNVQVPANANVSVVISKIELKNIVTTGNFDVSELSDRGISVDAWTAGATTGDYTFFNADGSGITIIPAAVATKVNVADDNDNLILLPQTPTNYWQPNMAAVGVATGQPYVVITYNMKLNDGSNTYLVGGENNYVIAGFPLVQTDATNNKMWNPGYIYTYTVEFGGQGTSGGGGYYPDNGNPVLGNDIVFTVSVEPWGEGSHSIIS